MSKNKPMRRILRLKQKIPEKLSICQVKVIIVSRRNEKEGEDSNSNGLVMVLIYIIGRFVVFNPAKLSIPFWKKLSYYKPGGY